MPVAALGPLTSEVLAEWKQNNSNPDEIFDKFTSSCFT